MEQKRHSVPDIVVKGRANPEFIAQGWIDYGTIDPDLRLEVRARPCYQQGFTRFTNIEVTIGGIAADREIWSPEEVAAQLLYETMQ